jgi:hypothetical protein
MPRDGAIIFGDRPLIRKSEDSGGYPMDTVLKLTIETICAAAVLYILFRENFPTMAQKIEGQTRTLLSSVRNQMTFGKPRP